MSPTNDSLSAGEIFMTDPAVDQQGEENTIGTIENRMNPSQNVDIKYLRQENAFVTSGISTHFCEKEILIPVHMVLADFQLVGAIISAVLEKISIASERDGLFEYASVFEVLDKKYIFQEEKDYMKLSFAS